MKNKAFIVLAIILCHILIGSKKLMLPEDALNAADNVIMCVYYYSCTKPAMEMTCCGQVKKIKGHYGKEMDFEAIGYEKFKDGIRIYYSFVQEKGGDLFSVDIPHKYYEFKGNVRIKVYSKEFFEPPPGITYFKDKTKSVTQKMLDAYGSLEKTKAKKQLERFLGKPGQKGSAIVTWKCMRKPSMAGYNLYISEESGKGYIKVNAGFIRNCKYNVGKLEPGKTYYFVMTTVEKYQNTVIESKFSREIAITAH